MRQLNRIMSTKLKRAALTPCRYRSRRFGKPREEPNAFLRSIAQGILSSGFVQANDITSASEHHQPRA
jgi:hypothetical protein